MAKRAIIATSVCRLSVRLVVISRKLSKTDAQLHWNTIQKLALLILCLHSTECDRRNLLLTIVVRCV